MYVEATNSADGSKDYYDLDGNKVGIKVDNSYSKWAEDSINKSIEKNLVPENLQFKYTNKITRQEFCQLAVQTYIAKTGNELNMNVARFTSEENMEERALIKEHFQDGGKLQAIVAIKCLDEGVNIPGIRTAFILASTTNPKEYIQRRGRVLRKAANKPFAEIYDFVTLPRPLDSVSGLTIEQANRDKTLVKNELARIKEFGRLALN